MKSELKRKKIPFFPLACLLGAGHSFFAGNGHECFGQKGSLRHGAAGYKREYIIKGGHESIIVA